MLTLASQTTAPTVTEQIGRLLLSIGNTQQIKNKFVTGLRSHSHCMTKYMQCALYFNYLSKTQRDQRAPSHWLTD